MKTFEYKTATLDQTDIEKKLNDLGKEGWEFSFTLQGITPLGVQKVVLVFKREVQIVVN